MPLCSHCGAPIALSPVAPTDCKFCGATNAPALVEKPAPQPIQIVQKIVHVVGASDAAEPEPGRCPHCLRVLVSVKVGEVELHGCPGCGGIWLDNVSAKKVLENPENIFYELATRAANNATANRPRNPRPTCPVCSIILDRTRFHDVDLDLCPEHGTWFDALELGMLVTTIREAKRILERDQSGGSVACVTCRGVVLRTKTHITPDGTICDACYLEFQRKMAGVGPVVAPSKSVLLGLHQALYSK
jgi:Zn-finger nucleic acid-binding protein